MTKRIKPGCDCCDKCAMSQNLVSISRPPAGLYNNLLANVPAGDTLYRLTLRFNVNNTSYLSTTVPINDPGFTQSRDGKSHKALIFLQNFTTSKQHDASVDILEVRIGVPSYQHSVVVSAIDGTTVSAASHTCPGTIALYGRTGSGATNFTSVANQRNTGFYGPQYLLTSWPFNSMTVCLQDGGTGALAPFSNTNAGTVIMEFVVVLLE